MIKICKSISEKIKYKKLEMFKNGGVECCPILNIDKDLFSKARELFTKGHVVIEVHDDKEQLLFYLRMQYVEREKWVNFDGCDLSKEKNLDISLLKNSNCFVFKELEEYTYELVEFIKDRFPDAHIIFLDENAKFFWDDTEGVLTLNSIYEIDDFWQGKYMFIHSDIKTDIEKYKFVLPEKITLVYDSINLMSSLCWARKVEHFGRLNIDKTILLIDMEFGKFWGLAYIVRAVCALACMALERGWIPVANLAGDNLYIDSCESNMWEQYFAPLSDISVEEARESYNVISVKNNCCVPQIIYTNPYFRAGWGCPSKHLNIEFADDVKRYIFNFANNLLRNQNGTIMGVIARGTDAKKERITKEEIDMAVWECREIMQEKGYDKLFLATEDAAYFDAFVNAFGNKLIYIEQTRISGLEQSGKPIGERLNIAVGEKKDFGQTYLLVTYCLSQCDALVYNIRSGGYYLANKWRGKPYEFICQIEGLTQIDDVIRCLEMINMNSYTAIYGTGAIGRKVANIINQKDASKIIYCDRKAENEKYTFERYEVISPEELLIRYRRGDIQGIIIATIDYAEEVYRFLIMKGIDLKHILKIKNIPS